MSVPLMKTKGYSMLVSCNSASCPKGVIRVNQNFTLFWIAVEDFEYK